MLWPPGPAFVKSRLSFRMIMRPDPRCERCGLAVCKMCKGGRRLCRDWNEKFAIKSLILLGEREGLKPSTP